jgi:hypothetical protein
LRYWPLDPFAAAVLARACGRVLIGMK